MDVKLLYATPEPERSIATAARLCYSDKAPGDIFETLSDQQVEKLINILIKNGHGSALEHAYFTFGVSGISRACTHQLVRHRIASYNQQSQRYVEFNNPIEWVEPAEIKANNDADAIFNSAMNTAKASYEKLIKLGISAEDARFVLPNACPSNIVITMNCRELLHFFSTRCCNRAQWEIRSLAWHMLQICQDVAPIIFKNAGPSCLHGKCGEGTMSCGKPYSFIDFNLGG